MGIIKEDFAKNYIKHKKSRMKAVEKA